MGGIFTCSDNCRTWHRRLALDCTEIISCGISGNNKCMLCIDSLKEITGRVMNTETHGENQVFQENNIIDWNLKITGQFIIVSQQGGVWVSCDFGKSWSFHVLEEEGVQGVEGTGYFSTSISGNGNHMYSCCSNGIYCSGDYGI